MKRKQLNIPDYTLIRSHRKTIAVEVGKGGSVVVRAPYKLSNEAIRSFLLEKQDWIRQHVKQALAMSEKIRDIEPLTEALLEELFEKAAHDIPKRVHNYAKMMGVSYGRITIRNQKTRWGSCSAKGNLNFNCLLMLAPEDVRDYVVIHELSHRKHMNHSKAFWQQVEAIMPDYKDKRKWLKDNGNNLMQRMLLMQQ